MTKIDPAEMERLARIKWGEKWRENISTACHVAIETVWRWRQNGMPIKYRSFIE